MWKETNNQLHQQFVFANFSEAMAFIVQIAIASEKLNHHPTFTCTYNKVDVWLQTHDKGNMVTALDWQLAAAIDSFK